jgi:hypothetical protein
MFDPNRRPSDEYNAQLERDYGADIVRQLNEPFYAELPEQPGQEIPYVVVNEHEGSTPMLYVPGFGESIVNKVSFAAELASQGVEVILPGQNRKGRGFGRMDAVEAQALNYLAVIEAEGLTDQVVNVATHSFGSLVFDKMAQIAEERGWTCFKESTAFMMAPAGLNDNESYAGVAKRWAAAMKTEGSLEHDFPDVKGETAKASLKTLLSNPIRTAREVRQLVKGRVNFERLLGSESTPRLIGRLMIYGYAEDELYPSRVEADAERDTSLLGAKVTELLAAIDNGELGVPGEAVDGRLAYATPISLQEKPDGNIRSGEGATHDDEQLNPSRVAGAVVQVLRLAA